MGAHFVAQLRPELVAYARAISVSGDDAEDLVQEAIARALNKRGLPIARDELRAWLFRVIRNLQIDGYRRKKVQQGYV